MKKHSEISPSNASRWLNCPGSVALLRTLPPEDESAKTAARLGSIKHSMMASFYHYTQGFDVGIDVDDYIEAARIFVKRMHPDLVPYVEYPDGLAIEMGSYAVGLIRSIDIEPVPSIGVEVPINLSGVHAGMGGTADAVIMARDQSVIEIIDYKSGRSQVDPKHNPQLQLYMIGAIGMTPDCVTHNFIGHFVTIAQPDESDKMQFKSTHIYIDELGDFFDQARGIANSIYADTPPKRIPSDTACQWCRAKSICPEYREFACYDLISDLEDVSTVAPEAVAEILRSSGRITKLLKSANDLARDTIKSGGTIPGYELRDIQGRRSVLKDPTARSQLLSKLGRAALQPIGVAALEKLAAERGVDVSFAIDPGKITEKLVPLDEEVNEKQN